MPSLYSLNICSEKSCSSSPAFSEWFPPLYSKIFASRFFLLHFFAIKLRASFSLISKLSTNKSSVYLFQGDNGVLFLHLGDYYFGGIVFVRCHSDVTVKQENLFPQDLRFELLM